MTLCKVGHECSKGQPRTCKAIPEVGSDKTRNEGNGNEEMEMKKWRNGEMGEIKVRPGE